MSFFLKSTKSFNAIALLFLLCGLLHPASCYYDEQWYRNRGDVDRQIEIYRHWVIILSVLSAVLCCLLLGLLALYFIRKRRVEQQRFYDESPRAGYISNEPPQFYSPRYPAYQRKKKTRGFSLETRIILSLYFFLLFSKYKYHV